MFKNKFNIITILISCAICSSAVAEDANAYIAIGGGGAASAANFYAYDSANAKKGAFKQDSFAFARAEFGIAMGDWRLGLEAFIAPYSKMTTDPIKGKIRSTAGFVNAYYDVTGVHNYLAPYIGLGFGVANTKMKKLHYTDTNAPIVLKGGTVFAWKVGLGSMFKITDKLALDANYFYMDMGSVRGYNGTTTVFTQFKRRVHSFSGNLVYKF